MSWLDDADAVPTAQVAEALGLEVRDGGTTIAPCPACGDDRRGYSNPDPRGPIGIAPDGMGWACHRGGCDAKGGPVRLAAWALLNRAPRAGDREGWAEVRSWFADHGWAKPDGPMHRRRSRRVRARIRPPKPHRTPPPPNRPPRGEVAELWSIGRSVASDPEVRGWLDDVKGLDSERIADRDLARALPVGVPLPVWASCAGIDWIRGGYRLLLPLYDGASELVSLKARCILPEPTTRTDGSKRPKSSNIGRGPEVEIAPGKRERERYSPRGTVLADSFARYLLRTRTHPDWWPAGEPLRVVIAEGGPDFLLWATKRPNDDLTAPAVFGTFAGGWDAEIAAAIPTGARVTIRTDNDSGGDKYAEAWCELLGERCAVLRAQRQTGGGTDAR